MGPRKDPAAPEGLVGVAGHLEDPDGFVSVAHVALEHEVVPGLRTTTVCTQLDAPTPQEAIHDVTPLGEDP